MTPSQPEPYLFSAPFKRKAQHALKAFDREAQGDPSLRPAAVAIVLTANASSEVSFLITRRSAALRRHPHQWALPGGRLDEGETALDAAIRESREEIGLRLVPEEAMGSLDDFATRSGFCITPIVFWCEPGQTLRPDPAEVEQIHMVSLHELEKPEVPILESIPESDRPVLSIPILGTQVFSPTAAILFQLREVILAGRTTRVAHYEQPVFAWK